MWNEFKKCKEQCPNKHPYPPIHPHLCVRQKKTRIICLLQIETEGLDFQQRCHEAVL